MAALSASVIIGTMSLAPARPALAAGPASTFYAESDWDDPIGDGRTAFGTSEVAVFTPGWPGRNSITVRWGSSWSHRFVIATDEPLVPGATYEGDVEVRGPIAPYGGTCSSSEATVSAFEVHDAAYDTEGDLSLLSMSVRQRCGAGDYRAEVRFNTSLPTFAGVLPEPNPYFTFDFGALTFPSTAVGAHSAKTIVELTSVGSEPVRIGAASISGADATDFSIHDNDCSSRQLEPGQTCTFALRFDPSANAMRTALASIGSDTASGGKQWLIRGYGQTATTTTIDAPAPPVLSPVRISGQIQPVPDDWPGACQLNLRRGDATMGGIGATCDEDGRASFEIVLTEGRRRLHVAFDGTTDFAPSRSADLVVDVIRREDWATVSISPSVFYPVADGYRDRLVVKGTRSMAVQVHLAIKAIPSGDLLEEVTLPAATGDYRIPWDGRDPEGAILPKGDYDVTVTLSDAVGNVHVVEQAIRLSHGYVTWTQKSVTLNGDRVSLWGWSKDGSISVTRSGYPRGVWLNSGRGSAVVIYALPVVERKIYGRMTFKVYGRSLNRHKAVVAVWNPTLGGMRNLGNYDSVKAIGPRQQWWSVGFPGQGRPAHNRVRAAVMVWKGLGGTGKSIFDVKQVRLSYQVGTLHVADVSSAASVPQGESSATVVGRTVGRLMPDPMPALVPAPPLESTPTPEEESQEPIIGLDLNRRPVLPLPPAREDLFPDSPDTPDTPEVTDPAEPAVKLRLHPKELSAVLGVRKRVTAWTCPADDRSPFGPDRTPGTSDDDCDPVAADWHLWHPAGARLSHETSHKVLVQLTALADNRLLAEYGELTAGVKLHARPRPDDSKPMPPLIGEGSADAGVVADPEGPTS